MSRANGCCGFLRRLAARGLSGRRQGASVPTAPGVRQAQGSPWVVALLLPLVAALPPLVATPPGQWLVAADSQLFAGALRLRGVRPAPREPLILAIDADSLSLADLLSPTERAASPLLRGMGPWPWPRALQAELVAWVLERGAARVLFNIVHSQPSRFGPEDDRTFAARLAPWRDRLVLAVSFARSNQEGVEGRRLLGPSAAAWPGGRLPPLGLTTLLQSPQGLSEAIPGRAWLRQNLEGFAHPWPRPLPFAFTAAPLPEAPLSIAIPGPAGTIARVSAWRLAQQSDAMWRGRTVILGVTAPELGDQHETAFGPMSGTDLEAAAIASVLSGQGWLPLRPAASVALLAVWGLLCGLLLRRGVQSRQSLALALTLVAIALLLSGAAWSLAQRQLPASALLLAPLLAGTARAAGQARHEQRERAYLHQLLARRLSPALLEDILRDPGPIWTQVGGSRCRCVLLFTDLVGFTELSARLEPAPLFALLNRYFEAITAAVIEQQGLVDKFIGDALMAEFGVPRSRGDAVEALAAATAALSMQRRLAELNADLARQALPTLRQGIGLHVGEVIAGNLGSSQRLEFTVIGAAVNLACRIEALTRRFPEHPILISAELRALLPADWPVLDLGEQRLKGWPQSLRVYALSDPAESAPGPGGELPARARGGIDG